MPPKYYLPDQTNALQRVKLRLLDRRQPLPPFPKHAQIQTVSGCNAHCIFCPNKKTELQIEPGRRMDMALFHKIVEELIEGGVERLSPYLMNESMLDSDLPERVAYITKRKSPAQYTKINSHGGLLTERMAKGLLDAGLNRLTFSVHGIEPEPYEQVMNLKLDRVLANIDRFLELKREGGYQRPRVRIAMLVTKMLEPQLPKIREYWGSRGIKIKLNKLENRGHHKGIQSDKIASHALRTFDWCNRMFDQIYILHDGRLVMCCADWEQTGIMGDASRNSIREIWNGEKYDKYRQRFLAGSVKGMICDGCSKDAVGGDDEDE